MVAWERMLHAVPAPPPGAEAAPRPARPGFAPGDVALTAAILLVALLPLLCDELGVGRWGAGSLGLGAAGAVLALRELCGFARAHGPSLPEASDEARDLHRCA